MKCSLLSRDSESLFINIVLFKITVLGECMFFSLEGIVFIYIFIAVAKVLR